MTDTPKITEAENLRRMIQEARYRSFASDERGDSWQEVSEGELFEALADALEDAAAKAQTEPPAERALTPCGNLTCTGCRVCGCPALGVAVQTEPPAEDVHVRRERVMFEALADRLGEHPEARNYEIADSGEYETMLRGPLNVEILAEWLMPTVVALAVSPKKGQDQ